MSGRFIRRRADRRSNNGMPGSARDEPRDLLRGATGFTGTETGVNRGPAVLGPILKKHKLALVSGWFRASSSTRPSVTEAHDGADRPTRASARPATSAETTGTVQNRMDAPLVAAAPEADTPMATKSTELAEWMATTAMTYHHHMGTIVETQREIDPHKHTGSAVGLLDTGLPPSPAATETTRKQRHINHVPETSAPTAEIVRQKDKSSAASSAIFCLTRRGFMIPRLRPRARSSTRLVWSRPSRIPPRRRPQYSLSGPPPPHRRLRGGRLPRGRA